VKTKTSISTSPFRCFMAGYDAYRYGFNVKEKDNETYGDGNAWILVQGFMMRRWEGG